MSSPFAQKLGTNHCPSDEELVEIKALLVGPTLQLKRIDDEIAGMYKAIDRLTKERVHLSAYVKAHKALVSPVRRLPLDIVQEIFMACIPSHRNCVMSARSLGPHMQLVEIQVALNASAMDEASHLSAAMSFEEKVAQRLETTKGWLDRSGQCPLSISLESSHDHPPGTSSPTSQQTRRFLQVLIPFASRWQHISFSTPPLVLDALSLLTEADVPILKTVALNRTFMWLFGILRGAQINSFSMSGSNFSASELPLRWSQLTALSITAPPWTITASMTSETILNAISRCPALRKCKQMVNDGPSAEIQSVHPIREFPFLHTFELHCVSSVASTFKLLLDRLSLPKLQKFTLHGHNAEAALPMETHDPSPLNNFFMTSTRLESLRIDTDTFTKSSLLEFIRRLPPSMQHLRIQDTSRGWPALLTPSLDDEVLAVLTPSPGLPPPHCPRLKTIFVDYCDSISDAALLRFITARLAPIESQLDILPSLQPLIQSGLDVSITHLSPVSSHFSPWLGLSDAPALVPMSWMNPHCLFKFISTSPICNCLEFSTNEYSKRHGGWLASDNNGVFSAFNCRLSGELEARKTQLDGRCAILPFKVELNQRTLHTNFMPIQRRSMSALEIMLTRI
ncbi:hypothetical protein DFH09DRAFT_1104393 [Mycena vulgaris]|nr:hypothetical protein DFH09DRAFT_1104393 [Mycena vulgaris]